jgi:hypothetical protein
MTRYRRTHPNRLCLEHLEGRSVPATFSVTTTLDVVDPADGRLSLREAITKANTSAGADLINVSAGVYKIALAGTGDDGNVSGDFDVVESVTIQGAGAGKTFVDGQQIDRVFHMIGAAGPPRRLVLAGLTVRNGNAASDGGGIRLDNADLVVRDANVVANRATLIGGGISISAMTTPYNVTLVRAIVGRNSADGGGGGVRSLGLGVITLTDSAVRRNRAGDSGGGISASTVNLTDSTVNGNWSMANGGGGIRATTATLTNSTVSGNTAIGTGGAGGGINATTATLTNSTVSGNFTSGSGGGIKADSSTLCTVIDNRSAGGGGVSATTANATNSTIADNSSSAEGGGMSATTATLTNSTLSGNTALPSGGGVFSINHLTMTNCTVSGNLAVSIGGGISASLATISSCTIVENLAASGGGIDRRFNGTINIRNSIIALNMGPNASLGPDLSGGLSGAFVSLGNNLIGNNDGTFGFTDEVNGDIVGNRLNPIDPLIGTLKNNGGPTKTHALLAGSPAIDKGDNDGVPATDQRGVGFARKKDGNFNGVAVVDIGAFER